MADESASRPSPGTPKADTRPAGRDFIRQIIDADLEAGRYDSVVTRFPPEPNGYLHLGHAFPITLNFGIAEEYGGRCHLRFDDTNPETEEERYVVAMQEDIRWLGFDWGEHLYFASDYFERMYECAVTLIRKGKAYVDSSSEEEIREMRGSVTEPGRPSEHRERSVEESLDLFRRMRAGEFGNGTHVLRGKIDLSHPNMLMRDPVFYRIRHWTHYRQGDEWCIYPLYDFAHCLEDAFEDVTHSTCSMEFENNRALYDWILDEVGFEEPRPHQYEFGRVDLEYTTLSKRRLLRLVREGHVEGWDDPRMPTVAGARRRGIPPEAVRAFCEMVGIARTGARVDVGKLEFAARDRLNHEAPRVMGVLRPLKLVVTNVEAGAEEWLDAPSFPPDVGREGSREVPFGRELWIERDDFRAEPQKGYRRLAPGRSVRLRYGDIVTYEGHDTDPDTGEVTEVRVTRHEGSRGGDAPGGVKVWGVIHWVSAARALEAEVRLYDRLFLVRDPGDVPEGGDFTDHLNPESLVVLEGARVEPSVADDPPDTRYQLERTGYFWRDPADATADRLVFNRIVTLRDTWSERAAAEEPAQKPRKEGGAPPAGGGWSEEAVEAEAEKAGSGGVRVSAETRGRKDQGGGHPTEQEAGAPRVSEEREAARDRHPELAERMERYMAELGLDREDADILTGSVALSDFFEAALEGHDDPPAVAAWVVNEVLRELKDREVGDLPFDGARLGRLVALVDDGTVSRRAAKDVFEAMTESGDDPAAIVERLGLEKIGDADTLEPHVDAVLEAWSDKVAEYREGKTGLLGFFVGQVMQRTEGRGDPKLAKEMLAGRLASPDG